MTAYFIVADVFEGLAQLPDNSVDLILSSPPYLALRSYLPADHPDKAKEIGSESTPAEFIDKLLDVVEACDRVLAPHGSLVIELGDVMSGSGGAGGDYRPGGMRAGQPKFRQGTPRWDGRPPGQVRTTTWPPPHPGAMPESKRRPVNKRDELYQGWPMAKSLTMVPESFRWALAYGRNPFNGRTTPPWRVRNVVRHFRPNPPVGALGDKVRPATSEWAVACKSATRYFDLDAVRGPSSDDASTADVLPLDWPDGGDLDAVKGPGVAAAPPLDWWDDDDLEWRDAAGFIEPVGSYAGAHYAVFSPSVVARFLALMCPERVCTVCGEPSRRLVDTTNAVGHAVQRRSHWQAPDGAGDGRVGVATVNSAPERAERATLGWIDCGHGAWRPGVVLDPFAGSGTTGAVANGHGRNCVLIDLDERNAVLARERIGMWCEVGRVGDPLPPWLVGPVSGRAQPQGDAGL